MPTTYEPIATTTLGTAASTITFSSITSAYTDLRLIINWQSTSTAETNLFMTFNSDTGSNYSYTRLVGDGASASSGRATSQTSLFIGKQNASTTSVWRMNEIDIFSYAGSTNKTYLESHATDNNGGGFVYRFVGLWRSTSAINTISIFQSGSNLNAGTTATLYGILRA